LELRNLPLRNKFESLLRLPIRPNKTTPQLSTHQYSTFVLELGSDGEVKIVMWCYREEIDEFKLQWTEQYDKRSVKTREPEQNASKEKQPILLSAACEVLTTIWLDSSFSWLILLCNVGPDFQVVGV
jgi:hypothetical protein